MQYLKRVIVSQACTECKLLHITAVYTDLETSSDGRYKILECNCGNNIEISTRDLKSVHKLKLLSKPRTTLDSFIRKDRNTDDK